MSRKRNHDLMVHFDRVDQAKYLESIRILNQKLDQPDNPRLQQAINHNDHLLETEFIHQR